MAEAEKSLTKVEEEYRALMEREDADKEAAMEGFIPRPPRIKVLPREIMFAYPNGQTTRKLSAVILGKIIARGLWTEGQKLPRCSSINGRVGQGSEADMDLRGQNCMTCIHNEWGSGKDGRGKACKEMRRALILEEGKKLPSVLSVPPTSLATWDEFFTSMVQDDVKLITTRINFGLTKGESGGYTYAVVQLEKGEDLSIEDTLAAAAARDALKDFLSFGVEAEDYGATDTDSSEENEEPPV